MNKSLYFMFTAASFALLVCAPGRLAYGIILIIEMNLLAISASAFHSLMQDFDLGDLQDILTLAIIVSAAILYRQMVILFSPVIALNLGFVMYVPAASIFLLGNIFGKKALPPLDFLMQSLKFSAFALAFFCCATSWVMEQFHFLCRTASKNFIFSTRIPLRFWRFSLRFPERCF